MKPIDYCEVSKACDKLCNRCSQVPLGHFHGRYWLFDQLMRAFDNKALPANSVTYEVMLNLPGAGSYFATIFRDGRLVMHPHPECPVES